MCALCSIRPATAQTQLERASQSIDIKPVISFQQLVQLDKWTPITITVRNTGAAVTGYLEVITADSRDRIDYQTRYRQPLELAKDAQKRLQFTVFISRIAEPLRIRVVTAGGEVASHSDVNLDYLNDRKSYSARVVYPLPDLLPIHWQGYDGVEAVILHRAALSSLSRNQYLALTQWISSGGTLLVSGGYDTAILRTSRIAQLLPARVIGTQQLDTQSALDTALGVEQHPLTLTKPLGIASVADASKQTLHHIDKVPLVLEHKLGRGSVVLLTFDLASKPFQTWAGMRQFMYRMLNLSEVKPVTLQDQQSRNHVVTPVLNRLTRQRAIDYPGHPTVIAFTAFYLVVLALYSRQNNIPQTTTPQTTTPRGNTPRSNTQHRNNRIGAMRESDDTLLSRSGKTLQVYSIPIIFSLGAAGLFHHLLFPQSPSFASVAVIEPIDNSTLARVQLELSSHSTRDHPLDIRFSGVAPMLRAAAVSPFRNRPITADQELATWIFDQGTTVGARPLNAFPYEVFSAHGSDIIDFAVSATYQANASLEFHNSSGRTVTDLWAITSDHVYELGAVADGQSVTDELNSGMPRERHQWRDKLQDAHSGSRVPVAAINALLDGNYGAQLSEDTDTSVLLVGFTSNSWVMDASSKRDHVNLTILAWRIHQAGTQP